RRRGGIAAVGAPADRGGRDAGELRRGVSRARGAFPDARRVGAYPLFPLARGDREPVPGDGLPPVLRRCRHRRLGGRDRGAAASAVGAAIGGPFGFLLSPFLLLGGGIPPSTEEAPAITRNWGWIGAAAILAAVFIGVLGPGVRLG